MLEEVHLFESPQGLVRGCGLLVGNSDAAPIVSTERPAGEATTARWSATIVFVLFESADTYLSKGYRRSLSVLRINRDVFDSIRTHGEETYPHECCGALLGMSTPEGWLVTAASRTDNNRTDSAHNRYQIAPMELVRIERKARQQGLDIAGFYHSHPDHPAQWSRTDLDEAHWLQCSYVITEIANGLAASTQSFRLTGASEEEKRFEQEQIQLEE